jgi:hypothetical protein
LEFARIPTGSRVNDLAVLQSTALSG